MTWHSYGVRFFYSRGAINILLLRSKEKAQAQSTKYEVQSTKYEVQSTKYEVQSTKYKV